MGTALKDIHMGMGISSTYPTYKLLVLGTRGRGDTSIGYKSGDGDIIYLPYTLLVLGTRGRGDSSIGYTGGDGDIIFLPYTLSFLGTRGRGDST